MFKKHITFNNRNSLDQGLIINSINISPPTPKLITISVPFSNSIYDFSTVNTGGIQVFNNRNINIKFSFKTLNRNSIEPSYLKHITWLLSSPRSTLTISTIAGTIQAKCTQCSSLSKGLFGGTFTATFDADPFFNMGEYGDYIWDTFNFNTDIAEINSFVVNSGDTIEVINEYMDTIPVITASNPVTISMNGKDIELLKGENNNLNAMLSNGINKITIKKANCTLLTFSFRKEFI